ncbi:hypothetical protein [Bacillus marinisedimentorum]|uniref:hypothetical protein n=1 Tax=Bacillus marinisedimentorum TaxID=1821260 RepID=UPI0007DFFD8D|nr:hypothetical protein [Bacillus marinisedimentorum]
MTNTIFFSGESIGVISDQALAGFMLFCNKQGLDTAWNQDEKRLDLSPSLKKFTFFISSTGSTADGNSNEIAENLSMSLANHGFSISNDNTVQNDFDLIVSIASGHTASSDTHLLIEHRPELDIKLKNLLYKELRNQAISVSFLRVKAKTALSPLLTIKCTPAAALVKNFGKTASAGLASALIRYFTEKQAAAPEAFLPVYMKKNLLREVSSAESSSPASSPKKSVKKTAGSNNPGRPKPETSASGQNIKAEPFFDYTIYPPDSDSEDQEYIITGHFNIKNTGHSNLYAPIICIRIDPINGAGLSGQIVPPTMTDTLSTQGQTGKKGWKYVYEDWMERIKAKGEYWITPIQPVHIKPGETESLRNFQVVLHPLDGNKHTTIDGFVYFNDGKDRFIANNRIQFSF